MRLSIPAVILLLLCLVPARAAQEAGTKAAGSGGIVLGLIPDENIFSEMERHLLLAGYIERKEAVKVRFTILSHYGDVVERFRSRNLDGAFFSSFTGLLAIDRLGLIPLVRPISAQTGPATQGVIIVRKDSGLRKIPDLRDKRAAFVDRNVPSYIYMLSCLRQHGYRFEKFFSDHYFTGNQDAVIYAVQDGRADVGFAEKNFFVKLAARDPMIMDDLQIIGSSPYLPDLVLCVSKSLAPGLREKLKSALVSMSRDPDGAAVLKKMGYTGFEEARASDFGPLKDLMKKAGIDARTYKQQ